MISLISLAVDISDIMISLISRGVDISDIMISLISAKLISSDITGILGGDDINDIEVTDIISLLGISCSSARVWFSMYDYIAQLKFCVFASKYARYVELRKQFKR